MSESRPTYRPSHILRCRRCLEEMEGTSHDAGRYHYCGGEIEVARKITDARPTYIIPARDVVPGMILRATSEYLWPVLAVGLHSDRTPWMEVDRGDYEPRRYGFRAEEVVSVQLPGPSPRELACTCVKDEGLIRTGILRWYEPAAAPLCAHEEACPVAPVLGRHGGMRLWPAPWRGEAWTWDGWKEHWRCGGETLSKAGLRWTGSGVIDWDPGSMAFGDMCLQCFYLPPDPQPERRETPAWDPYGTDLDLAVRYG